jgi:hypothetical protein
MRRAAGLSVTAPFSFVARIGGVGRAVNRSGTEYPRLGTGFGVAKRWDRVHLRFR